MKLSEKEQCCGCMACLAICKMNAIYAKYDDEKFIYPEIDNEKCVDCGKCENVCPILNKGRIKLDTHNMKVVQGYIIDDKRHRASASGGAATIISEFYIKQGGYVFGSTYYDDYRKARYIEVETVEKLDRLKGSKYIETEKNDIFRKVKYRLEQGKKVLFTGLPCDIGGLKYYLNKDFENLYTCELICHGPMSQIVQEGYIIDLEKKYNSKVSKFNSRYNKEGIEKSYIRVDFENDKSEIVPLWDSSYGYAFATMCRRSCYDCKFKANNRLADISIGDSWSVKDGFGEKKGVSIIYAHSKKGKEMLQIFLECEEFKWQELEYDRISKDNPAIYSSLPINKSREKFVRLIKNRGLKYANFHSRDLKGKIKYIIKKAREFIKTL